MEILSQHPVTISLALASMMVWTSGNRNKNKKLIYIGIALSALAILAYILGL